ncbi:MAG: hypothetical protein AAB352_03230 [Patescibacteria group bacterium]
MENDQSKAKDFLKLFPRESIINFINAFEHGIFFADMFADYDKYNNYLLITFENPDLNKAFRRFDEAFLKLRNYLGERVVDPKRLGITDPDLVPIGDTDSKLNELVENLKREYIDFTNTITQYLGENKITGKTTSNQIKEIICVEPKNSGINSGKLVINGNYQKPISVDLRKNWHILFEVARSIGHTIDCQTGCEDFLELINTNKKCKIYSHTKYTPTKILKNESGQITSAISIEVMSDKIYNNRLKNPPKATEK